jgi:hypothetical protein
MAKARGYPDRRGMGAQSDFIAEPFVPSEQYKAQQKVMIQTLVAAGLSSEHLEGLFFVPAELISAELISEEKPKDEATKEVAGLDRKQK